MVGHFDTCLGCMACETACPSGVRYAPLIEETRAAIEHHHERPAGERLFRRLLFMLLPYPARLRVFALPLVFVNLLRGWTGLLQAAPPTAEQPHRARTRRQAVGAACPSARPRPERRDCASG